MVIGLTDNHRSTCASLVVQSVKNLPVVQDTQVQSLGWEDPLEKEMATHSSILAWRISWTEEPGGLQSMGSQRVEHNWVTNTHLLTYNKRFTPNFTHGTGENIFHIKLTHSQAYFVGTSADSQVTQEEFRKWAYLLWGYCVAYSKIQISIYTGKLAGGTEVQACCRQLKTTLRSSRGIFLNVGWSHYGNNTPFKFQSHSSL